jgi:hypothetical protein
VYVWIVSKVHRIDLFGHDKKLVYFEHFVEFFDMLMLIYVQNIAIS